MKNYKYKLVQHYVHNKFHLDEKRESLLSERFASACSAQQALKYQIIESPGPASEGRVWYSAQSMIHSYYQNMLNDMSYGTQIWKRNEAILFGPSLLKGEDRINYIQVLEPGIVVSLAYTELMAIREEFHEVMEHLEEIIIQNEKAYQHRIHLLNEPSTDRVKRFEAENSLFCTIASVEKKAMHVGLSRQGYSRIRGNY